MNGNGYLPLADLSWGANVDVWRITLAALRRWYVLVPLLALTGLVVVLAGSRVAPEYEAQASAMLAPERAEPKISNPYGDITGANAALGIVLSSVETRRAIQEQGLPASYEIGTQPRSTIFQIAIRADTPQIAERTGQAVLDLAEQELSIRQTEAGLPEAAQYTLAILEPPAITAVVDTGKLRVQAVVGVLGAGLSLLVTVLFDDIVGLWKRSREKRRSPGRRSAKAETASLEGVSTETTPAETTGLLGTVPAAAFSPPGELPRRRPNWARPETMAARTEQPASRPEQQTSRLEQSPAEHEPFPPRSKPMPSHADSPAKQNGEQAPTAATSEDDPADEPDASDTNAATSSGAARRS